jgi:hypothetical protein
MIRTVSIAVAVSSVMAVSAWADPAPQTLHACAAMKDSAERLACFDRAMVETPPPTQTQQPTQAPAPVAPAQSSPKQFGEENLPRALRPLRAGEETTLLSSIKALRAVGPQTYAISLSNGQVWRQEEGSHIALFFHVGDDVRIEKGALGSYHMSAAATGSKNWVRVTRIE